MANPVLSANASNRWCKCPPSARVCAGHDIRITEYYDESFSEGLGTHTGKDAAEGKECHQLAAYKLRKALGEETASPVSNLVYHTQEMDEFAEDYCAFTMNRVRELSQQGVNPLVYIEQHIDFSRYTRIQGSVGIADCLIIADGIVEVIDLKYGAGVTLNAEGNSQLMIYALGALELLGDRYSVSKIRLHIFQPRRNHVSSYAMSLEELLNWANTVLAPAARMAYEGEGEFTVGDHCKFCPVKATCRKRAEQNLELAEFCRRLTENSSATLTYDEIAFILARVDNLTSWANEIKACITEQAESGIHINGFKLVRGRNNRRQYTDEEAVARIVKEAGYEPRKQVLLNPAEMTRLLGRKQFDQMLGQYICLSPGKPTLVPDSDKRPALSSATEDFSTFIQRF